MHYGLQQKIDDGLVEWIKKETVSREDLVGLGREEVDGVVDAVFVTLQVGCVQSKQDFFLILRTACVGGLKLVMLTGGGI